MATIQVRNVPDEVHRVIRMRAASAGMSLQEFVLAELIRSASRRTPAEIVADTDRYLGTHGPSGFTKESSADTVRNIRESR